jgi:hypothetical protein
LRLIKLLNLLLSPTEFEISRRRGPYIDLKQTIKNAEAKSETICEYVEELWNIKGNTDFIVDHLKKIGVLTPCEEVCEIGPGTGRYLERLLKQLRPIRYHIYEIDRRWADYLSRTYKVIAHPADGHSLTGLKDNSCGFVSAHGVFTYIPLLNSFEYFLEAIRITGKGGHIVFDIFPDIDWNEEVIDLWLRHPYRYPAILPEKVVIGFFSNRGCKLTDRFDARYGCGHSTYLVFKKSA